MGSDEWEFVLVDQGIGCDEGQIVGKGLADEEAVEGVSMDERKGCEPQCREFIEGEVVDLVIGSDERDIGGGRAGERQFAEGILDGDFGRGDGTEENVVG
jgi:hypothetical protein